jgi:hypothetical protein
MMSDLIQRLRDWASEPACYEVPPPSLLREAADTIERLTAELAAARETARRLMAAERAIAADERERCAVLLDTEHKRSKHMHNYAAVYARAIRAIGEGR